MKWLVWLALGLLVYFALRTQAKRRRAKHHSAQAGRASQATARSASPASKPIETMVVCSYCQIYLPASEATQLVIKSSEHYFCCEEHAKLHSDKNSSSKNSSSSSIE